MHRNLIIARTIHRKTNLSQIKSTQEIHHKSDLIRKYFFLEILLVITYVRGIAYNFEIGLIYNN